MLSARNRISRRDVVELCEKLFGSRISTGTIDAILARVADGAGPAAGDRELVAELCDLFARVDGIPEAVLEAACAVGPDGSVLRRQRVVDGCR